MWAQYAATEFPTEVRSLACNMIFALGRTSSIFLGLFLLIGLPMKAHLE